VHRIIKRPNRREKPRRREMMQKNCVNPRTLSTKATDRIECKQIVKHLLNINRH